jgi:hypothetical protein
MNRHEVLPVLSAVAVLLAATDVAAQLAQPVPANADLAEGHEAAALPFGLPGFRTQILIDGPAVGQSGAVLTGIRFRTDRTSSPLAGGAVPNVTVRVGETAIAPPNLGVGFAANATAPLTTVFQGTVQLPASSAGHAGPLPWDVEVPFAQPFVFTTANGSLLIDIVGNNPTGGFASHYLDAVRPGGTATRYGQPGDNPSGDFLNLIVHTGNSLDPTRIAIGNVVEFSSTLFFSNPPGLLALGIAPAPGPIDLGFLGATNQFLHVDPLVLVPHGWTQTFIGWSSTFALGVPNDPSWIDDVIYAQSALFDPTANPFGIVLSHAVEVRIADNQQSALPMQQVDADDPSAAAGVLLDFGFGGTPEHGAVPILLEGVFF